MDSSFCVGIVTPFPFSNCPGFLCSWKPETYSTVELSSSQPPRLLLVRTRSLGRAPTKKKKKKNKRKKKRLHLERGFWSLGNFPGTQAELRRVGKFSFLALIIRKTHLLFSSKLFLLLPFVSCNLSSFSESSNFSFSLLFLVDGFLFIYFLIFPFLFSSLSVSLSVSLWFEFFLPVQMVSGWIRIL